MPQIELSYQGQSHTLNLTPDETTRDHILQLIKNQWSLCSQQYSLTYADSQGDQISVDTHDDFDVARETMATSNDSLVFKLHLNQGVEPTIKKIEQPNKEEILTKEEQLQLIYKKEEQVIVDAHQPQNAQTIKAQQNDKNIEAAPKEPTEKVNISSGSDNENSQQTLAQKKAQKAQLAERKRAQKQALLAARAKAKQQAQLKKKQREAALKQAQRVRKQERQAKEAQRKAALKLEAEQKKKFAKLIKLETAIKSEQKQKEEVLVLSQQKQKSESKPKQSPKYNLAELSVSSLDVKMTEDRVKQLIREEVMKMIPELKDKILGKQVVQPIVPKKEINYEIMCSACKYKELKVPFYYNAQTRAYICNQCQSHDASSAPLLKIRDPQHFQNNFFTFAGVVSKEQVEVGEELTFEKFIENAKLKAVTKIKEDLKKKSNQHKKKATQDKSK